MTKAADYCESTLLSEPPQGWRRTTLGAIGEYINGRGFKKSEWCDRGLPIIRIQNLTGTSKELNYYDGEIDERHVINPGDLLISWAATLGVYFWSGPKAALNQHIFKVRSFIDKKFHYYLIRHILADLYRHAHGSGMVHITKSKFESMPVTIPEAEEDQKRIVAEIEKHFSRLDEGIASLKRVQANLKRYKAAVLKAAVEGRLVETEAELARREGRDYETGEQLLQRILAERRRRWEEAELAKMKARGKVPKNDKWKQKYKEPAAPDTTNLPKLPEGWVWATVDQISLNIQYGYTATAVARSSGVRFLRITDLQDDGVNWASVPSCDITDDEKRDYLLRSGDIVFARTGATVGKSYQLKGRFPESVFASYLIRISPYDQSTSDWLSMFFRSPAYWNQIKDSQAGIGQPNVNGTKLRSVILPLPPRHEQHRIVAEVERCLSILREVEAQVEANLQRAERLRQSILAAAFSGRLVPNEDDSNHVEREASGETATAVVS